LRENGSEPPSEPNGIAKAASTTWLIVIDVDFESTEKIVIVEHVTVLCGFCCSMSTATPQNAGLRDEEGGPITEHSGFSQRIYQLQISKESGPLVVAEPFGEAECTFSVRKFVDYTSLAGRMESEGGLR
jgi:hypothetical protein